MPRPLKSHIDLCSGDRNMALVAQMEDSSNCLPAGWITEVKTRKSGLRVGQKYKCYIAPMSGCKMYSMRDVFRYLNTGRLSSYTSEVTKRSIDMHSANKVDVEKHTAEGLPPGWIKKVRVSTKADRVRRDPYYIDPKTGYVFRSKKEVYRYLEFGIRGRCANKRKKRSINDMESIDGEISPPAAAKRRRLAGNATRRSLFKGQSSKSSKTVDDELMVKSSVTQECLAISDRPFNQCGESTELSSIAQQEAEACAKNMFVSVPAAKVSPEKKPLEQGMKKRGRPPKHGASNPKDKKELPLPRRSSKRIAALHAELAPDLDPTDQACHMAVRQSANLEPNSALDITPGSCNRWPAECLDLFAAAHSPKGTEVVFKEEPSKEDEKPIGNQAALEELIGKLETEPRSNEKPKSPLVLPFGDSWPDPCLEFAFKTLTGAIPVEDNLAIGDYFQQQLSMAQNQNRSSFTLPDTGLNSYCQTDLLFRYSAPEKSVPKQQSVVKPTFSSEEYDGLVSSGVNVLQQGKGAKN